MKTFLKPERALGRSLRLSLHLAVAVANAGLFGLVAWLVFGKTVALVIFAIVAAITFAAIRLSAGNRPQP
jgi:hypothetical protein